MVVLDTSGGYPIIVGFDGGPYFARQGDADEGIGWYDNGHGVMAPGWTVINEETGDHVAEGNISAAAEWVDLLNTLAAVA